MIPYHKPRDLELRVRLLNATLAQLSRGDGFVRAQRETVRQEAVKAGVACLVGMKDEDSARMYLRTAAEYALKALTTNRVDPSLKIANLNLGVDPETRAVEVNFVAGREGGHGTARMSVHDFGEGFFTLWAFGSVEDLRMAAKIPEVDFRSPGIISPDWAWRSLDADKALALGDEAGALRILRAVSEELNVHVKGKLLALEALIEGAEEAFRARLLDMLKTHKKLVAKSPGDLAGLICFPATMLCRVALRHGIAIEDQNYLPLRFMPGHPANTSET